MQSGLWYLRKLAESLSVFPHEMTFQESFGILLWSTKLINISKYKDRIEDIFFFFFLKDFIFTFSPQRPPVQSCILLVVGPWTVLLIHKDLQLTKQNMAVSLLFHWSWQMSQTFSTLSSLQPHTSPLSQILQHTSEQTEAINGTDSPLPTTKCGNHSTSSPTLFSLPLGTEEDNCLRLIPSTCVPDAIHPHCLESFTIAILSPNWNLQTALLSMLVFYIFHKKLFLDSTSSPATILYFPF